MATYHRLNSNRREFLRAASLASLGLPLTHPNLRASGAQTRQDDFEIWDLHCHLDRAFRSSPDDQMKHLVQHADRLGIDRLVLLTIHDPDAMPDEIVKMNDIYMKVVDRWRDRAVAFVYLNGRYPEFCLEELNRCVRDGPMVGVKFKIGKRCSAPDFDPLVQRAAQLKAPVYQHTWIKATGNLPGESTPSDVAQLAARHPHAPLICGHGGADWEVGIRAVRAHPNVFVEVGGFDPTAGFVEKAVRELGASRVLYGSNAVGTSRTGRSFGPQLAKVLGAELSDTATRLILGENLRKLLRPIMNDKGLPV